MISINMAFGIEHNFFEPQPVTNASIYILRAILHDWADPLSQTILSHLRKAASPNTKLVIGDFILSLACARINDDTNTQFQGVDMQGTDEIPFPLLPNMGKANALVYSVDLAVRSLTYVICYGN
jgi:hypothetical protein